MTVPKISITTGKTLPGGTIAPVRRVKTVKIRKNNR
jgi:hypothetical protein